MTDEEAINIAKRYCLPIVHIPPIGCIDEIITVNLLNRDKPIVIRSKSVRLDDR